MQEWTLSLLAALLASGASWVANGTVVPKTGSRGIAYLTPLLEETAKTLAAAALGAALLWTHVVFGLMEALLELRRRGVRGLPAGWSALAAHSLFGLITAWIYGRSGVLAALAAAYLAHAAWNMAVVAYAARKAN
ncbi:type II CAAX prenyl endopeptidase Rce1 family protein [Desulfotomaculum nigrificans]|uniref:CPBP family glutamic-type intramembrane protease n=1 Tax=Desulfotomaculum nigrificans TaxID=1565 RepID=UPI0001FAE1A7|nr:CPBP family glutamic-type intramembrane protease [Desulfotomaculum nigrificans]